MLVKNLSFKEIKSHVGKLAVLSLGSTEQHGPYLPLGTDAIFAEEIVNQLEKIISDKIVIFPTLSYGCAKEHIGFPGTVYIEFETYMRLMKEIFRSIFDAGFSKLLLIGAHGGNDQILRVIQSDWNYEHKDQKVHYAFAFNDAVKDKAIELFGSVESHAGSTETSMIYAISSEYIKTRSKRLKSPKFLRSKGKSFATHSTAEINKLGIVAKTDELVFDIKKGRELFNLQIEELIKVVDVLVSEK